MKLVGLAVGAESEFDTWFCVPEPVAVTNGKSAARCALAFCCAAFSAWIADWMSGLARMACSIRLSSGRDW